MAGGFLKLPMTVFASDMWRERRPFSRFEAVVWLYLHQQWEPVQITYGNRVGVIDAGECAVTIRGMACRFGWSEKKVRVFLDTIVADGIATVRHDVNKTIVRLQGHTKGHSLGHTFAIDNQQITPTEGTPNGTPKGTHLQDNILQDNIYSSSSTRAREEIESLKNDSSWVEITCMRFHMSPDGLFLALDDFADDCLCRGIDSHAGARDLKSHFISWQSKRNSNNNNGNGKIIGHDAQREQERQTRLRGYAELVANRHRGKK